MSRKGREIADYLADILVSIAEVEEFLSGMTYEVFAADKKTGPGYPLKPLNLAMEACLN